MSNFIPEFIDLSKTRDTLICVKCGEYRCVLDENELCEKCFYEESNFLKLKEVDS